MKKSLLFIFIIILLLIFTIAFFLLNENSVKFYEEIEISTTRNCQGNFWHIITANNKNSFEQKYNLKFPENDYSKNYLLLTDGRKVKSLKYKYISKLLWDYDVPKGIEEFDNILYPNTMFVYKIDPILLKQADD